MNFLLQGVFVKIKLYMYFTCQNSMLKLSQNLLPDSNIVQDSTIVESVLYLKLYGALSILKSILYDLSFCPISNKVVLIHSEYIN